MIFCYATYVGKKRNAIYFQKTLSLTEVFWVLLADMPIARRNSLHRFLEKRKGR